METFPELFKTILRGDKETSRKAAREVRRRLYYSAKGGRSEYKSIEKNIRTAPEIYAKIIDPWRQENFVLAISVLYFLHSRDDRPDFLFSWLFQLLQHENGNVRHASVRMLEHEFGTLTYHIRFPAEKHPFAELAPESADQILHVLRTNLESLAARSWKQTYNKIKYIDELPSGTYKSTQLILECLDDYCSETPPRLISGSVKTESMEEILKRRKEIQRELTDLLKATGSDFTLAHVLDAIYNEEGSDDPMKIIAMFDYGGNAIELENILDLITDAWNYFPHEALGGMSPAEKILNYRRARGKD